MTFVKGVSGCPTGKPKGTLSKVNTLIKNACPEILNAMIAKAVDGDSQAAALILNRGIPNLRPNLERVEVLTAEQIASMSPGQKADAVNASALTGKIPPDTAAALLAGIQSQLAIVEVSELAEEVAEMKAHMEQQNGGRGRW